MYNTRQHNHALPLELRTTVSLARVEASAKTNDLPARAIRKHAISLARKEKFESTMTRKLAPINLYLVGGLQRSNRERSVQIAVEKDESPVRIPLLDSIKSPLSAQKDLEEPRVPRAS